ncbi:hypothetical protein DVK05_09820 [Halorubrum sp. Atlit-8R]|nr:hypothetical protein DVK05_09820 [Halorubrum sp. Atlit-8R]
MPAAAATGRDGDAVVECRPTDPDVDGVPAVLAVAESGPSGAAADTEYVAGRDGELSGDAPAVTRIAVFFGATRGALLSRFPL